MEAREAGAVSTHVGFYFLLALSARDAGARPASISVVVVVVPPPGLLPAGHPGPAREGEDTTRMSRRPSSLWNNKGRVVGGWVHTLLGDRQIVLPSIHTVPTRASINGGAPWREHAGGARGRRARVDAAAAAAATRPKIKIIHIIAPEIIKTDVANFRDLVQRLTGKPACARAPEPDTAAAAPPAQEPEEAKKRPAPAPAPSAAASERSDFTLREEPAKKRKIKCEVKVEEEGGFGDYDLADRGDLWMDLNPGGFLSFLEEDDDVFLQGMAAPDYDFLQPFGSTRMDLVGEMYAS
ncbi:hypothetical protein U9M48_026966 [Paspalum notatum var. saurae]|uniref:VQ domain-containing protein n=1 Tax=Paspalum notatum var. saurae TaxID=547442 RepID=A0AAQ3WZI4_PASNO